VKMLFYECFLLLVVGKCSSSIHGWSSANACLEVYTHFVMYNVDFGNYDGMVWERSSRFILKIYNIKVSFLNLIQRLPDLYFNICEFLILINSSK
jgi:hypothetical protein